MARLTPDRFQRNLRDLIGDLKSPRELRDEVAEVVVKETRSVVRRIAYDTGQLHDSIHKEVTANRTAVVADAPHAVFVAKGTRHMRARPFDEIGLRQSQPLVERALKAWGDRQMRELGS